MAWIAVAIGTSALGAIMQERNAEAQRAAQKRQMLANAEQIRYSPWTGAKVNVEGPSAADPTGAALGGALQGGLAGAMMGAQFQKLSPKDATPTPTPAPTADAGAQKPGVNMALASNASYAPPDDTQDPYDTWGGMKKPNKREIKF